MKKRIATIAAPKVECREGCGACCDPVTLPFSQDDIRQVLPAQFDDPSERDWILNVLTPMPASEGYARAPWLKGRSGEVMTKAPDGSLVPATVRFYRCGWLDPLTKQCTNYDNRPAVCRDYPTYGMDHLEPEVALPPWCSYQELHGSEPAPLPER